MMRMRYRGLPALFCSVLVLHLWAGSARAALAQPTVAESGSVVVIADTAEVREGPSPDFSVITVVEKGEIFLKQGRTGAWYYIRINGDTFGWISGRAVSSYQGEGAPPPYAGPSGDRSDPGYSYYPYYPGYFWYSSYWWGQPYLSWEWYYYGNEPHRYRSWDHDRDYPRDRDRDWQRDDDDDLHRGNDSRRDDNSGRRSSPPRPPGPRLRPPFMRR